MAKNRFTKAVEEVKLADEHVTFADLKARAIPKRIKIVDTEPIGALQIRSANIDPDTSTDPLWVNEIVEHFRSNPELEPEGTIVIAGVLGEDGKVSRMVRVDGNHFMTAKLKYFAAEGLPLADAYIDAQYAECTEDELKTASLGVNAANGKQLTNTEKLAHAKKMLLMFPDWADGRLHKFSPVITEKTYGNVRNGLIKEGKVFPTRRLTANGKWIETGSIGAKVAEPKVETVAEQWSDPKVPGVLPPAPVETVKIEVADKPKSEKPSKFVAPTPNDAEMPVVSLPLPTPAPVAEKYEASVLPGGEEPFMEFSDTFFLVHGGMVTIGHKSTDVELEVPLVAVEQFIKAMRLLNNPHNFVPSGK